MVQDFGSYTQFGKSMGQGQAHYSNSIDIWSNFDKKASICHGNGLGPFTMIDSEVIERKVLTQKLRLLL